MNLFWCRVLTKDTSKEMQENKT